MNTTLIPDRRHWPEYLAEAGGLGLFMISASVFTILFEHPESPLRQQLPDAISRRAFTGIAMGLTAMSIIYSRMGRRSGAHLNPAVTFTFFRLGKIAPRDVTGYVIAQFTGGVAGMILSALLMGRLLADPAVDFAVTKPGAPGIAVAFFAELVISAVLMLVVLSVSNTPRTAGFTGVCAGVCVATFITFEGPLSGMSINPARTLASAVAAGKFTALWIYFLAPPLGMALASLLYQRIRGRAQVKCAKLQHAGSSRCIFCEYHSPGSHHHQPAERPESASVDATHAIRRPAST